MVNSSRSKAVAQNTSIMFGRMMLLISIGLFTSRETLRILGVDDFGVYNLVGTIVTMFVFLQTALNEATSRYIIYELETGDSTRLNKTFSMSINIELILAAVIFVLMEAVGPWFIENKLIIPDGRRFAAHCVFQISLLNSLIGLIRTPFNSIIIAHERFGYFAYSSIIEAALKLAIVYILTVSALDRLITFVLLQTAASVAIFLWMFIYCRKKFPEAHYHRHWDGKLFKSLSRYSGLSLIVNVADIAVIQSFGIFFNLFCGVVANAALGITNQVNSQLNNFLGNFSQSYRPQIVKSYASGDRQYFFNLIFSAGKLAYFLYFALAFPIMLNIGYILNIWLDEVPENTGLFICLMIGYYILDSFSEPLWCSVYATGNLKVHQMLMGAIKIMNIPVSYYLLTKGMPIYIVLVVHITMNLLCTVTRIWWMTHLIKLNARKYYKEVIGNIIKVTAISIPVPLIINQLCTNRLANLFITTFVFLIIYGYTIYKTALNEKELKLINKGISKILRKTFIFMHLSPPKQFKQA